MPKRTLSQKRRKLTQLHLNIHEKSKWCQAEYLCASFGVMESDRCTQIEGYRKILQFINQLDFEVNFVKQYIKSRISKMPDFQIVLTSSGTLNQADHVLLQNSSASDAVIERSFSKLRKLLQKDWSFADKSLTYYVAPYVNHQ